MKVKMWIVRGVLLVVTLLLCICCDDTGGDTEGGGNEPQNPSDELYEDIVVVDGKVRFYLEERANSTRTASGLTPRDWLSSKVVVAGKSYAVALTDEPTPRPYVDVDASFVNQYKAALITESSNRWLGSSLYSGIHLPHSLFDNAIGDDIGSLPMYAAYSEELGNIVGFDDAIALLRFRLKGSAKIASVKVLNPEGSPIAGIADYSFSANELKVVRGHNFVVLNTTNNGEFAQLSQSKYRDFYIPIAAGFYSEGLQVTFGDSQHLAMFYQISATELSGGELRTYEVEYAPDDDLVFYEGFDNCVWGGDVVKGAGGVGFSPTSDAVDISSGTHFTGYEYALSEVTYDVAGTGFVQSNVWSEIDGDSVGESHQLSDSYVRSRNFADTRYMFRVQEHPGYIAIGAGSQYRGVYCSPVAAGMKLIGRMSIKLRFSMQTGFNGVLHVEVLDGGIVESARLNGRNVELTTANFKYQGSSAILTFKPSELDIPQSAESEKQWSELELVVENASESTRLYINDENMESGHHGVYVDSIESRQIDCWSRDSKTLRVMVWNLQFGMWCDQHNNYDNFVAWVKRYDPDVCVWLESESYVPDNSASGKLPENERFLPNGWPTLAARYGHSYVGRGGDRDNGSQTVTSRYPIVTLQRLVNTDKAGKPLFHGAGHFSIEVNGRKVNVVSQHLWYQDFAFDVAAADQAASAAQNGGDYYRLHEIEYIVNQTVNNPAYSAETMWFLCGDMNSRSRCDNWLYNYDVQSTQFLVHDFIGAQTDLVDVMNAKYGPNCVMATTSGLARLDFVYASPSLNDRVERAAVLIDGWCSPAKNGNARDWLAPSDHRPLLVDLTLE